MPFGLVLYGIIMGLFVTIPLGPVGVMCIQRTINRGWKSGLVSGLGAAFADTIYAIIAGLGVGVVVNFIEREQVWIQLVGSVIIIIIAVRTFLANPAVEFRNQRNKKNKPFEEFLSVFLVTISNPAVFFAFIAMYAGFNVFDKQTTNVFSFLIVILSVFIGAMSWWYLLSTIINKYRTRIRLKNIWWLNKIMGGVIFLCGVVFGILACIKLCHNFL
jgi:threonine/homoserine/homoserine lactone efflux protein